MKQTLFTIVVIVFFVVSLLYFLQRQLIYFPDSNRPSRKQHHAEDMQWVSLTTQDNIILHSWYKPAVSHHPTILFFHGNAGNIGGRMPIVRQFLEKGYGVLLLEYRGYGGNPSTPTEKGLYEDARAALHYLQEHQIPSSQIILYGESLGTGVATKIATETQLCGVILQSPFTSLNDVGHFHYPWMLFMTPWDKYDSMSRIQSIHAPLLVIHGTGDLVVPYEEGKALFDHALPPKEMLTIPGGQHSNLWQNPKFIKAIEAFIHRSVAKKSP